MDLELEIEELAEGCDFNHFVGVSRAILMTFLMHLLFWVAQTKICVQNMRERIMAMACMAGKLRFRGFHSAVGNRFWQPTFPTRFIHRRRGALSH